MIVPAEKHPGRGEKRITDLPETRHSLLLRLRDREDAAAWEEFLAIYEPVIHHLARRRGLQHSDALDITQEVLLALHGYVEAWDADPSKGTLRGWLFRVTRNLAVDAVKQAARREKSVSPGDTGNPPEPAEPVEDLDTCFGLEFRREAFRWAAREIRPEYQDTTWQAFWRTAVDGQAIPQVARELGLSVGALYAARCRVLNRLRNKVQWFEGQ